MRRSRHREQPLLCGTPTILVEKEGLFGGLGAVKRLGSPPIVYVPIFRMTVRKTGRFEGPRKVRESERGGDLVQACQAIGLERWRISRFRGTFKT